MTILLRNYCYDSTVAGASTNSYPDIPDDGLLFKGGGYVTFTAVTDLTAMTTFFSRNDKWLPLDLEILNQMLRNT